MTLDLQQALTEADIDADLLSATTLSVELDGDSFTLQCEEKDGGPKFRVLSWNVPRLARYKLDRLASSKSSFYEHIEDVETVVRTTAIYAHEMYSLLKLCGVNPNDLHVHEPSKSVSTDSVPATAVHDKLMQELKAKAGSTFTFLEDNSLGKQEQVLLWLPTTEHKSL